MSTLPSLVVLVAQAMGRWVLQSTVLAGLDQVVAVLRYLAVLEGMDQGQRDQLGSLLSLAEGAVLEATFLRNRAAEEIDHLRRPPLGFRARYTAELAAALEGDDRTLGEVVQLPVGAWSPPPPGGFTDPLRSVGLNEPEARCAP